MIPPVTIGSITHAMIITTAGTTSTATIGATGPMIAATAATDGTTAHATNSA